MDIEQEDMQFVGLFGIYKEAYKVIYSCRQIFIKIALALVLPLSFIFLAHVEINEVLLDKIIDNEFALHSSYGSWRHGHIAKLLSKEWTIFFISNAIYLTFLFLFSLLSTSAVVYTVACIYTARDIGFKKVMSVVPKVWKRLLVTFLSIFVAFFLYNFALILTLFVWAITIGGSKFGLPTFIIILILYVAGLVYMSVIWHLASVVSVLENVYGFRAMMKSKDLIKGKLGIALIVFFKLNLSFGIIRYVFERLVVYGDSYGLLSRLGYGIMCLLLLMTFIIFGLVIQTLIYFVCKSYHHQNIDKSSLSDHLQVYLGDYVPLTAKDVQLEHLYV